MESDLEDDETPCVRQDYAFINIPKTPAEIEHRKLSNDTLAILTDFYNERDDRQKRFEQLKLAIEDVSGTNKLSMDMFTEDWNSSQFWVTFSPDQPHGSGLTCLV